MDSILPFSAQSTKVLSSQRGTPLVRPLNFFENDLRGLSGRDHSSVGLFRLSILSTAEFPRRPSSLESSSEPISPRRFVDPSSQ